MLHDDKIYNNDPLIEVQRDHNRERLDLHSLLAKAQGNQQAIPDPQLVGFSQARCRTGRNGGTCPLFGVVVSLDGLM